MGLVYATDVLGDNREYVKKRGDAFSDSDGQDLFGMDGQELLDEGVIVMDSALPENADDHRSMSYYEMQAAEAKAKQEEVDGVAPTDEEIAEESKEAAEESNPDNPAPQATAASTSSKKASTSSKSSSSE